MSTTGAVDGPDSLRSLWPFGPSPPSVLSVDLRSASAGSIRQLVLAGTTTPASSSDRTRRAT